MSKKTRVLGAAIGVLASSLLFVSGALAAPPAESVTLDKVADPASLPAGGGDVTYWYTVTNTSIGAGQSASFQGVALTDDKCDTITFDSSSDGTDPANAGDKLAVGEWWKFKCETSLTETTTNTAWVFACKDSSNDQCNNDDHDATATDSATVTVGTVTATIDTSGTSAAMLALILLAIGGFGFLATTNRLPKLPKIR
jgi:hypothetical protein